MSVIRVDLGVTNHAVLADHVARWHRQGPGRVVIDQRQVVAQGLVEFDQVVRQLKAQAECIGNVVVGIAEDRETQLGDTFGFTAVGGSLRRQGQQACANRLVLWKLAC